MDQPIITSIKAGFPSPAEDFQRETLDITKLLARNPAATFYARVSGDSMTGDGIEDGDLLVVDRSVEIYDRCVAVCCIDGEFTVKRVALHDDYALLMPSNKKYPPIKVTQENNFIIWGVVRYLIKKL